MSMPIKNQSRGVSRALKIIAAAILVGYVFLIVNEAQAQEDRATVAAWKYQYPNDTTNEWLIRIGQLQGAVFATAELLSTFDMPRTEEIRKCAYQFLPDTPAKAEKLIEGVFTYTKHQNLDPSSYAFFDALTWFIASDCAPDQLEPAEWRST